MADLKMDMSVKGLDVVMRNLNTQLAQIKFKTQTGIVKAAFMIKRDAMRLSPVITGNLRSSCFVIYPQRTTVNFSFVDPIANKAYAQYKGEKETVATRVGNERGKLAGEATRIVADAQSLIAAIKGPSAAIGFGAFYAAAIHEWPLTGKTGREGASTVGQWKFLQTAVYGNQNGIIEIIRKEAHV